MEYYPNYYETDLNLEFLPKPPHDKSSYNQYIISLTKLWCKTNDINYNMLLASLLSSVLQGEILVVPKKKEAYLPLVNKCRMDKLQSTAMPKDILYSLHTKYNLPLSDYSNIDFMVGYKNYLLSKLGGI